MEVSEPRVSFWKRIAYIFYKPSKAFAAIQKDPVLKEAFIIVLALAFLSGFIALSVSDIALQEQKDAYISKYERSEDGIKGGVTIVERQMIADEEAPPESYAAFTAVAALINCLAESAVWFLIIRLFKGRADYKTVLAMFAHIYVFVYIKSCILQYLQVVFQTGRNLLSLQLFMETDLTSFFYNLCSRLGVFEIWQMLIVAVGLQVIGGFTRKKGIAVSAGVTVMVAVLMAFYETLPYIG